MEIKKYLFKNQNNNQKDSINKMFKRNQKNNIKKDSIFNKKQESSNSLFNHQNVLKTNIFLNTKTNSSNNIINNSSIFNSYYQSQSTEKKCITKKKSTRTLNFRNLSQANKISLNNKKKLLTTINNTTAASLINNQLNNYNKCITDRYYEENKIKYINGNKLGNSKIIEKSKILINKDLKDSNYFSTIVPIPKKPLGGIKKEYTNLGKNIIKSKLSSKESKYQLNFNDNNKKNINSMNENILFKKKILNFKNSNTNIKKSNKKKMKNQIINNNINNNINKNKINNLLNIKKLNLSNLSNNYFDGKIIQGIMTLNTNNTNINTYTDSTNKKEYYTDRANYNYLNNINSQIKTKEIIKEQYNNINNNYIIANIINNIKYNNTYNNKPKRKNISRNRSIKLSERKNTMSNNLTSLNVLLKNSTLKNYPSLLKIKTIDISKTNNKTPSIENNISFNKRNILDFKIMNKRLFDANNNLNVNLNKRNLLIRGKNNLNIKFKKKGKNYKKLTNVPLKLMKKSIFHKEKKLNLDMNLSNNFSGFDKLNILTFNYIHSFNINQKIDNFNKRKLSQGNNSDRCQNLFQLINNKNNINDSKRNSNCINKTENMNKTSLIYNIPRQSNIKHSKYINSLSNYEINKREKEIIKSNNTMTEKEKKNLVVNNMNNARLKESISNQKYKTKKPHSNSPFNINCLIKKKYSKKDKENSKSRNINRIYKNYVGCLNNESKTNTSRHKTDKSSKNKKEQKDKNYPQENNTYNNNKHIKYKKRLKNLSVAGENIINKSSKTEFNNALEENEKQIKYSFKDIFSSDNGNNNISNKNKKEKNRKNIENEYELDSVILNSKSSSNKIIQKTDSVKSKNQSEFSNKSRNINNSVNDPKNKTSIKENKKGKDKGKNKEKEREKDRQLLIIEEYFEEIIYSLLKEETEFISQKMIDYNYLLNSDNEITPEMRAMVVDWLIEVHQIFHFQEKCLFTTIQLMDKYLSKKIISIDQFQLLALTALNVASKQEEVEYPILDNFITISKNTVTKQELIDMENDLLSTIKFNILSPTTLDYFQIYASVCNLNPVEISQGLYIMNILLIDINMLKYNYSILSYAVLKLIAKEENLNKLILFIEDINKKSYIISGNKTNEAQMLIDEINKENNSNEICKDIKYLFRTILKTHYHNAKNKFNNQIFHAVSSYTSI